MSSAKYKLSAIQMLYGNELGVSVDDLTFDAGRLHLLTGPNGSGKSTLLNVLAFLTKPDRGQIFFDGVPVKWEAKERALLRRRVTLLHQHPYMFAGTVAGNVAFGPAARGLSKGRVESLVKESLVMVGLEGFELRNARQLSGGESRRVALARALACDSEVLLLDEPTAHVDRGSAEIVESLIASLAARGSTIVMSSHDERLGARLGGRVIYLEDGKVVRTSEQLTASAPPRRTEGDSDANVEEARRLIFEHSKTLGTEAVELIDSLGLVTAEEIVAPFEMPVCDNSAMDGFAVRVADCIGEAKLRIVGFIPAGGMSTVQVEPGCAVRIMTGAKIPPGADAVVPFEEAEASDEYVTIQAPVRVSQHIRFAGTDVHRDEIVIPAGTVIRAPEINMIASFGRSQVTVFRRPRVAILSTGDELVAAGEPLVAGKIVDSNGMSLAASVKGCGAIVERLGIAKDTHASHVAKMMTGLQADIFITSAGVSVGDRDLVREVLAELGMKQVFYGVDVKPGGPTTFGLKDGRMIFCLPGNPVASMIIFDELVRPAILKTMGYKHVLRPRVRAVLQEDVTKKPGTVKFLRVRLESHDGKLLAFSAGDQTTGMLKTLIRADGIALLPAERSSFSAGDEVDVRVISNNTMMLES